MNKIIQPKYAMRVRPNMPDYGVMPDQTDGMLTWDWVDRQMRQARNYWLCTTCPNGRPHAVPVWAAWVEGYLYFGTDRSSVKARNIQNDNRVVIHLESGDETLIVEGTLSMSNESEDLQSAIGRVYLDKYGLDPALDEEDVRQYRLQPHKIMAWLESDFPSTATYWLFDV